MFKSLSPKRILLSGSVIAVAAAIAIGATGAFFSDEETSRDNVFTAGAIDLQIDNSSYLNTGEDGAMVPVPELSWGLTDLTNELFFNYDDVKPGDLGEDTVSLHVNNNPAWLCVDIAITGNDDNDLTEPEEEDGDITGGDDEGELATALNFIFWADDGDNVLENNENVLTSGPASDILNDVPYTTFPLADSNINIWTSLPDDPAEADVDPLYIGKAWCFGEIGEDAEAQDGVNTSGPDDRGPGVTCNGEDANNVTQTDSLEGDIRFRAVQSRNNSEFTCEPLDDDFGGEDGNDRPEVGALVSGYNDPETCDLTVIEPADGAGEHETLASALAAATTGNTICVDPSYTGGDTFPVSVSVTDVTIAGLGAMGDANIPGGLFIDASGVTITGLEFTDYDLIQASANAAIYIHNEEGVSGVSLTDTTISHNIFTAPVGAIGDDAKGIITEIGNAAVPIADGIDVLHNVFDGWNQAMFFNTAANYEVAFNDILNNTVGVANDGPHNASIHNNDFEGNTAEAVGVAPSATNGTANNGSLTVNTNNLAPAGAGNNVNWYGVSVFGGADVDATGNWWDGEAEAARTNDTAEVDTSSPEAVAFPEN